MHPCYIIYDYFKFQHSTYHSSLLAHNVTLSKSKINDFNDCLCISRDLILGPVKKKLFKMGRSTIGILKKYISDIDENNTNV